MRSAARFRGGMSRCIRFSRDRKMVAALCDPSSKGEHACLRLWDVATGGLLGEIQWPKSNFSSAFQFTLSAIHVAQTTVLTHLFDEFA